MLSIRIERLSFAYSDRVPLFRDVDLHLGRGFTGVVGENGSGKSTLLRLVGGELAPRSGRVIVGPDDALVAVCPQDLDELCDDAAMLAARSDASAGRWRAILALEDDQLGRWFSLSPGERRRWQLGGALAREPDVLLLDEPTNHIDATCRARVVDALRRFDGIALVISHDRVLLDELTVATLRIHGGAVHLYPGGYSEAKAVWEADEHRAREVRADARRVAAKAHRHLVATRVEHRGAVASTSAGNRKKGIRDHDATNMGRQTVIGWAEDRLGRRVEV
ncbi:MAG TPA: ATP-binding cassette domain-containing protein, partial [Kofleriaceae bacterium]|nr:ATP-binding cassette domain-containing protein [Kofleriaceae bacterium]